ncbi:hypothetical protein CSPX01_12725 [Colletotrichum filicis]|nr:hypothetical protein CSPX01_12725 [Colletotrichum filicis]
MNITFQNDSLSAPPFAYTKSGQSDIQTSPKHTRTHGRGETNLRHMRLLRKRSIRPSIRSLPPQRRRPMFVLRTRGHTKTKRGTHFAFAVTFRTDMKFFLLLCIRSHLTPSSPGNLGYMDDESAMKSRSVASVSRLLTDPFWNTKSTVSRSGRSSRGGKGWGTELKLIRQNVEDADGPD